MQLLYLFHIETSHLICSANQMTNFYMKCNIWIPVLKWKEILESNRLWFLICWKSKLKKKNFSENDFFTKYTLFAEKMFLHGKKVLHWKIFYREKHKWKCKKIYISFEKYIFMQKVFPLQIKYKSFLNSFCKIIFFDHKKYIC